MTEDSLPQFALNFIVMIDEIWETEAQENILPQNKPLWYKDYFKENEKQQTQEKL